MIFMPFDTQMDILNPKATFQPPATKGACIIVNKDMPKSSRKDVAAQDKKEDQHSSNMPIPRQKTETMIRNKVIWQKNIRPGGRIDWIIVGFNASTSVEKKVEAQIDWGKTIEKDSKNSEDKITATIPLELEPTVKENALRLVIGESLRKLVVEAVEEEEAITTKYFMDEIAVLEEGAMLGNKSGAKYSVGSHGKYRSAGEVTVSLCREANQTPLKYSRDGKVGEVLYTVGGVFKPSKWLRQITPVTSSNLPIRAERKSRDAERKGRDLYLRTRSNQESKTTSSSPTPKRPLSKLHSCGASPKSPPVVKLHPAEVLRSYQGSTNSSSNNFTPNYCPTFNTQSSKARLNTSICPRTNHSLTMRPEKSVIVASRMITHALGKRTISRVLKPEI
ncbi:f4a52bc2-fc7f-42ca-8b90-6700e610b5c1 [Sclerotinia trifoliorum]|uniref:F4a52bc2-fc7f-42ca-8b90-6700e610b5c1 n=1 Tax=Sclerotinia trifoliorum TaxID=28548 RepID=A0A8H2W1A8_9HELO|nr:f4a52bc2-fc7f-42ca-8b90-6700e610b5c1 [Sclerotinia trifoliorum]